MTETITKLAALRIRVGLWRSGAERIALVPTMGALHAGHMSLVQAARAVADRIIVSIFVNPTQFGPAEDFSRYPRTLEADLALLAENGVDVAWVPDVETMYPQGFATTVHVQGISERWEGSARPGHFDGVATVVSKLLLQAAPDIALFGEKDYQQLCVIKRMVTDMDMPVQIQGIPTLRDADGLAMSSRNRYLSAEERAVAPMLYQGLQQLSAQLKDVMNEYPFNEMRRVWNELGFTKIDYLALCDAATLEPLSVYKPGARLLVAAWLGKTRLIDNIEV